MLLGIFSPDLIKPTVSVTTPTNGATVSGTITPAATASDDYGVAGVQFKLDGGNYGAEDTASPFQAAALDTHTLANGAHTLAAVARDRVGNTQTASNSFTVSNTTPASGNQTWGNWPTEGGSRITLPHDGTYLSWTPGNVPTNPDTTHYQLQCAVYCDRLEQNADGGTHFLDLYVGGVLVSSVQNVNGGTTFGVMGSYANAASGGAIELRNYASGGDSSETCFTDDIRIYYQYVLKGGYLS